MEEPDYEYNEPPEPWFVRRAVPISLASIVVLLWVFRTILHTVHVHFLDQLAYPHFTEDGDEITTEISWAGWYVIVITLMLASRLFLILKAGGFKYHMDREAAVMWNTWFIGLTVYTVFIYALDAAIPEDMPGRWLIWPTVPTLVALVCYRIYKAILHAPTNRLMKNPVIEASDTL